ncbi:MAG: histidine phosphatase family protein [Sphingomonadales bacterium]
MKTLCLMRHAKSEWTGHVENDAARDHDRGLTPRGIRAARTMATYMADNKLVPDLALCSTAVRARLTLDALVELLATRHQNGSRLPVRYSRALYFTSPERILHEIHGVDDGVDRLLVVGHNPDTQAVAVQLAGDPQQPDTRAMAAKFPTAALAVLTFDVKCWRGVNRGGGRLAAFIQPKTLG